MVLQLLHLDESQLMILFYRRISSSNGGSVRSILHYGTVGIITSTLNVLAFQTRALGLARAGLAL